MGWNCNGLSLKDKRKKKIKKIKHYYPIKYFFDYEILRFTPLRSEWQSFTVYKSVDWRG